MSERAEQGVRAGLDDVAVAALHRLWSDGDLDSDLHAAVGELLGALEQRARAGRDKQAADAIGALEALFEAAFIEGVRQGLDAGRRLDAAPGLRMVWGETLERFARQEAVRDGWAYHFDTDRLAAEARKSAAELSKHAARGGPRRRSRQTSGERPLLIVLSTARAGRELAAAGPSAPAPARAPETAPASSRDAARGR